MAHLLSPVALWAGVVTVFAFTAAAPAADAPGSAAQGKQWVYVGTYTNAKSGSKGIYRFDFDAASGQLTPAGLAAEAANPSFLAIHPTGKYLFAVGEFAGPSGKGGGVSSFHIDPQTGMLSLINQRP